MATNRKGDKPERRQTETAKNHNGDIHFKRTDTATVETASNGNGNSQNGDRLKWRQTGTATN